MKCDLCGNEATVHLTEIAGSVKKELHLCRECAAKKGAILPQYQDTLSAMLAGIASQLGGRSEDLSGKACPHCGISMRDFQKDGRLGCSQDYSEFAQELLPLIENIHSGVLHRGKVPSRMHSREDSKTEIARLKEELRGCIKKEEFERAALLRDRIYALGGKLGGGDGD